MTNRKRCARQGCVRWLPPGSKHSGCCALCSKVAQEVERASRLSQATGDRHHWEAAEALNDALTDYLRSDVRILKAAQEVGMSPSGMVGNQGGRLTEGLRFGVGGIVPA